MFFRHHVYKLKKYNIRKIQKVASNCNKNIIDNFLDLISSHDQVFPNNSEIISVKTVTHTNTHTHYLL